tara:strand:- start:1080 stop:1778 length:699 start_codon:yes stop_codon:yes gene_type:complete
MNKKIIVAIDSNNLKKIIELIKKIKNEVYAIKLGYEFFYNFGITGYNSIKRLCPNIFLDLKLHDIPNTVKNGILAIEKLKPIFTTIHISGGDEMQLSCINSKKNKMKILGVSILTSLNPIQTKKYYKEYDIKKLVKNFVKYAKNNKLDGIVCSSHEIKTVRKIVGNDLIIVVPGIRPNNHLTKYDDQKRFMTPEKAIEYGADFLVIGRPITKAKDPLKTIKEINKSINSSAY